MTSTFCGGNSYLDNTHTDMWRIMMCHDNQDLRLEYSYRYSEKNILWDVYEDLA
jgi:hypothetical protein